METLRMFDILKIGSCESVAEALTLEFLSDSGDRVDSAAGVDARDALLSWFECVRESNPDLEVCPEIERILKNARDITPHLIGDAVVLIADATNMDDVDTPQFHVMAARLLHEDCQNEDGSIRYAEDDDPTRGWSIYSGHDPTGADIVT